jgi:hypothetical protein
MWLVNSGCQWSRSGHNDFASSIKSDEDPTLFTSVGNEADRVQWA